jgi:uncharacterized membrane protein
MRHRLGLVTLALVAATRCAGAPEEETAAISVDCSAVTVPKYSELTIWPLCISCHSSTLTGSARKNAPANINFDTYAAAQAQAARAAAEVKAGTMPERGSSQPTDDEKAALYAWAACGTPN